MYTPYQNKKAKEHPMKKILKVLGIILAVLILLVVLALLGFKAYDGIKYKDFYSISDKEIPVPGINDDFVPQGFEYYAEDDLFFSSGYMSSGEGSRIYVIDREGNSYYTELCFADGGLYVGHAGGVTYNGELLYVADFEGVDVFKLSDILDKNTSTAKQVCRIDTFGLVPAFCLMAEGESGRELLVGSFHDEESYPTDKKFHMITPAGDDNRGTIISYALSSETQSGVDESAPTSVYSLPSHVQGVTVVGDQIALSTSFGLSPSQLYFHDIDKIKSTRSMGYGKETFGVDIPLYHIDSSSLTDTVTAAPMSEEMIYLNGKLWIMNESACNKYIFGKITSGARVRSFKYPFEK